MKNFVSDTIWFFRTATAVLLLGASCSGLAQVYEILLPAKESKPGSIVFRKIKEYESKGQWLECAHGGRSGFSQSGIVKGWVLRTWLKCAVNSDTDRKKNDETQLALKSWSQNTNLREGPWSTVLLSEVVKGRFWYLENYFKQNLTTTGEYISDLFDEIPSDDKKSRARAWAFLGDLAQLKHDLPGAASALEQSLRDRDDRVTQEKYSSVLLAMNRQAPPVKANVSKGSSGPGVSNGDSKATHTELEQQFEDRFKTSAKDNDLMVLLEDCVSYLNAIPNGQKSKWAANKVLEIHQTIWDRLSEINPQEKWDLIHDRLISTLDKVDSQRVLEWLPTFHRRGDYELNLKLAERIRAQYSASVVGNQVLWFGGRAAQLKGQLKKAESFYNQFLDLHSGSEQIREVQFQLALTHLRSKNYSSAIAILERLLQSTQVDRMELNARYWMVRALQAQQNPRAIDESRKVTESFPFSYYGIRLRSEHQNGFFEWPFSSKALSTLKGKIHLNASQKRAWDRMQWLKANGWVLESQIEAQALPVPGDPLLKVLLAQELSKVESFPSVIKLLTDVTDLAPDLRSAEILQLGMPKVYQDLIAKEAKKRSMHPILIRSLIRQESAFFPRAVSTSNALGLMQLIPPTAREVAQDLKMILNDLPEDVFVPSNNLQLGSAYLEKMLKQFEGSVPVALASYNAGPRRVLNFLRARPDLRAQAQKVTSDPWEEMWIDELPWAETTYYVKAILRNTILYKTLEQQRVTLQGVLWQDLLVPATQSTQ